jgi:hypothetical protein
MASSSASKQPLLVDRPLHVVARLDQSSQPAGSVDPGTGTNGVLLVDCTGSSDGAMLDTIYLIQRSSNDATVVNLFFSTSNQVLGVTTTGGQTNAWFINTAKFVATAAAGMQAEFVLPYILAPIPHSGGQASASADIPPRYRGLMIPRGLALWAAAFTPTPNPNAPNIGAQGGWY